MGKPIKKGVSFQPDDKGDMALLAHALDQGNFSAYVKRLIFMDMRGAGVKQKKQEELKATSPEVVEVNDDDIRNCGLPFC
jgi:hypothetical protein